MIRQIPSWDCSIGNCTIKLDQVPCGQSLKMHLALWITLHGSLPIGSFFLAPGLVLWIKQSRVKLICFPLLENFIQIIDCIVLNCTIMYPLGLDSKSQAVPLLRGGGANWWLPVNWPSYTRIHQSLSTSWFWSTNGPAALNLPFWIPKPFGLISTLSYDRISEDECWDPWNQHQVTERSI